MRTSVLALLVLALAAPAAAAAVPDFALLDHRGRFHALGDHRDAPALVLFVHGNGCPIARNAWPALRALRDAFAPRGVVFWMLNANPQDDRERIAAEARAYAIDVPILVDETQLVAASLDLTRTAEALLIDPATRRIVYRGPVDDRLSYETQKPAAAHYLRDALRAHLAGESIETPAREPRGCLITFERGSSSGARISYADAVAPILERRCRGCHRPDGVAPWAMTDYAMVRGWSAMIGEVIRTRRMPPWQADPAVGRFANDLSIPPEEAATLVRWVEAGAPRGDGPDPLRENPPPPRPEWALGTPDLVLEAPRQHVPATGVVPYRYETVEVGLDHDAWIRAADVQPTNPRAMHHGTAYIVPPDGRAAPAVEGPRFARGLFAGYVPGRTPQPSRDDGGFFLPAGSSIRFELHYNTTGRPETDTPRIALYLSREPLAHELAIGAAVNFDFEIPPGAREHRDVAVRTLTRDVLIYRLTPHMHYRGKAMTMEAHYPDGTVEVLLRVPNYNFNWQRQYVLVEPKRLPAGTRVVARATFDNSARNPANPDPTRAVGWGLQSFDEMLIGYFVYRELAPDEADGARTARARD